MFGRTQLKWSILMLAFLVVARPVNAEDTILYCAEQHLVGLQVEGSEWSPTYGDEDSVVGMPFALEMTW
ncbi:hypothetical protein SAMN04488092_1077 [Thalassovita taeanensis]|uniref:Uncharacterized protein n=2 Tax=Thalassovita taeanensis TaxID=657014 RepID=A0A1H9G1U1_9RHOB|nr:hypothetical protein SAMN04488092_1077 [Thalassovita taeanensis]